MVVLLVMRPPHHRDFAGFNDCVVRGVRRAFIEDSFLGDITTLAVLKKDIVVHGRIVCLQDCVLAGVEEALETLGRKQCKLRKREGCFVKKDEPVIVVEMKTSELLMRIRVALNYLSHLSGLATNAKRLSKKFGGGRLAALRKTTPGLGVSEKRALQVGGVMAHRINLGDAVLIKKEHVLAVQMGEGLSREGAVGVCCTRALGYVKKNRMKKNVFVEVEVETLKEARAAASAGVDVIMLDNVRFWKVPEFVKTIRSVRKGIVIEASGGIREGDVRKYLDFGVDVVSGTFVLGAKPVDFRFVLE